MIVPMTNLARNLASTGQTLKPFRFYAEEFSGKAVLTDSDNIEPVWVNYRRSENSIDPDHVPKIKSVELWSKFISIFRL